MNKGLFTSNTDLWETPKDFFNELNKEFNFQTDVCAIKENRKCKRFFSPEDDGLKKKWGGVCWMNPPYGQVIGLWVKKAFESAKEKGSVVVGLLPARTDTKWFHDFIYRKAEIRFIKGRLKFGRFKKFSTIPFYDSCVGL